MASARDSDSGSSGGGSMMAAVQKSLAAAESLVASSSVARPADVVFVATELEEACKRASGDAEVAELLMRSWQTLQGVSERLVADGSSGHGELALKLLKRVVRAHDSLGDGGKGGGLGALTPMDRARTLMALARASVVAADYTRAFQCAWRVGEVLDAQRSEHDAAMFMLEACDYAGHILVLTNRVDEGMILLLQNMDTRRRMAETNSVAVAAAEARLAMRMVHVDADMIPTAQGILQRCLAVYLAHEAVLDAADTCFSLSTLSTMAGDKTGAARFLDEAVVIMERAHPASIPQSVLDAGGPAVPVLHPAVAITLLTVAGALADLGMHSRARSLVERGYQALAARLPANHALVVQAQRAWTQLCASSSMQPAAVGGSVAGTSVSTLSTGIGSGNRSASWQHLATAKSQDGAGTSASAGTDLRRTGSLSGSDGSISREGSATAAPQLATSVGDVGTGSPRRANRGWMGSLSPKLARASPMLSVIREAPPSPAIAALGKTSTVSGGNVAGGSSASNNSSPGQRASQGSVGKHAGVAISGGAGEPSVIPDWTLKLFGPPPPPPVPPPGGTSGNAAGALRGSPTGRVRTDSSGRDSPLGTRIVSPPTSFQDSPSGVSSSEPTTAHRELAAAPSLESGAPEGRAGAVGSAGQAAQLLQLMSPTRTRARRLPSNSSAPPAELPVVVAGTVGSGGLVRGAAESSGSLRDMGVEPVERRVSTGSRGSLMAQTEEVFALLDDLSASLDQLDGPGRHADGSVRHGSGLSAASSDGAGDHHVSTV
jgi:hypothetical protein